MSRYTSVLATLIALGLLAIAQPAGAQPKALSGDAGTETAVFTEHVAGGQVAPLSIFLTEAKPKALRFTYLTTLAGQRVPVASKLPQNFPVDTPAVAARAKSIPGSLRTTVVHFQIGIGDQANPKIADGFLQVRVAKGPPSTFTIKTSLPTFTVEPQTPKLQVTRWYGPLSGDSGSGELGNQTTVRLTGDRGTGAISLGEANALLGNSRGRSLQIKVSSVKELSARQAEAILRVNGAGSTGDFTGNLSLGPPGTSPPTVPVDVGVQDALIWPLATVLFGALLGWLATRRYEDWRRRRLIRNALQRAYRDYEARLKKFEHRELKPYPLGEEVLGSGGELFPTVLQCRSQPTSGIPAISCRLHNATSDAEFSDLSRRTNTILGAINQWIAVADSLDKLTTEAEKANLTRGTTVSVETKLLQRLAGEAPENADEATAIVSRLHRQTAVINAYAKLTVAWKALEPDQQERHEEDAPDLVYSGQGTESQRDSAKSKALLIAFATAGDRIRDLALKREPAQMEIAMAVPSQELVSIANTVAEGVMPPSAATPEVTEARIRRWDWLLAMAIAIFTAVAYLLPGYIGKDFGSWNDYLSAFCAGLLGQAIAGGLVINWSLFPSSRSYQAPQPKPSS